MKTSVILRHEGRPRRIIVFGDIHGCLDEATTLLDRIGRKRRRDVVIAAGDLVRKGPDTVGCIELWRSSGFLAVRGNNEERLLARGPLSRLFSVEDREILHRRDLLLSIASWPLAIDFPEAGVIVVHGGLLPATDVDDATALEQQRKSIPRLRYIRRDRNGWQYVPKKEVQGSDELWAPHWDGNRFIVYGHTPVTEPRFDKRALGIDTGCVYGGKLTAAIFEDGRWRTESVPAKKKYAE